MTSSLLLLLDVALALVLVVIGLCVLLARDLFQSIVLFIVFGMMLGVAWCRLEAVDVALAEVAIGSGLTGALLLNTLAATRRQEARHRTAPLLSAEGEKHVASDALVHSPFAESQMASAESKPPPAGEKPPRIAFVAAAAVLFATVLGGGLAAVVVPLARASSTPTIAIGEALTDSGATNPVTAVLLNFRAYDTMLEVAVLIAAMSAVLATSTYVRQPSARQTGVRPIGPVLGIFVRLLVPLAILVATYVLWAGTKAPGGAFQAAAVLGAGGVLLIVCGAAAPSCARRRWRTLLVAGLAVFLLVGLSGIVLGGHFLELASRWASASILLVETALAVSITLILMMLFHSTSPEQGEDAAAAIEHEPATSSDVRDGDTPDTQEPLP